MPREANPRTVPGIDRMSAALAIRDELVREVPRLLQAERESAKIIALRAGVTPRCVEGLREHEHAPSAHVLLALAKQYPTVRALVLRLMDAETGDSGESPAAVLDQIAKLVSRVQAT